MGKDRGLWHGKHLDNGEWVEGFLIRPSFDESRAYIGTLFDVDDHDIDVVEVDPETLGEYTGLTDKNGVKIFEGDILRCASEDWNKSYITKVWAYGNTLCVDIDAEEMSGYMPIDFADEIWCNESYEIEVIGNIHDNPELLEVKL